MAWKSKKALRVVEGFVEAVNAHDPRAAGQLLHPSITYIDSLGGKIRGREDCVAALERFTRMDDLFVIHVEKMTVHLPAVLLRGYTTARDPHFARKALWRAEVSDGMLSAWQSFAIHNPPPLARILSRDRSAHVGGSFVSLLGATP